MNDVANTVLGGADVQDFVPTMIEQARHFGTGFLPARADLSASIPCMNAFRLKAVADCLLDGDPAWNVDIELTADSFLANQNNVPLISVAGGLVAMRLELLAALIPNRMDQRRHV